MQPLLAGIYTADADRLSMAATLPELLAQEQRHGSLTRGAMRSKTATESGARYGLFVAPRDGMGSIVQTLADRLPVGAVRLRYAGRQGPAARARHLAANAGRSSGGVV